MQVYTPGDVGSGPLRGRLLCHPQSFVDDATHGLFYFETAVIAPPEKTGYYVESIRMLDSAETPECRKSRRKVEFLNIF